MRLLSSLFRTRRLLYEYSIPRINNVVTYPWINQVKQFSTNNVKNSKENIQNDSHNLFGSVKPNYKIFDDKDAEVILDTSEKQETINLEDLINDVEERDPYMGLNLERGVKGVYDIEDLVSLLKRDNAQDIFVVSVDPKLSYIDYMVVVTGKSNKHMSALAAFVRKVYKLKKHKTDVIPKIEGSNCKDWIALDLGNIALHIFSKSTRELYDLETLWSVGPDYDDKNNETGTVDLMEQYNIILNTLNPVEKNNEIENEAKE
ncbi:mitochondrial assembly of ribosomal large subunit protein 1 [Hylaeus volcanicus]|uniref:mitochondrial assembly of ribosomal large subunit protein 1 n=1 Tax=Hylaeus volcanicus TaxID=313075 RepID=UPI0023B83822|nr:mitochondrial assembly of ribosomal large subunit protein 1 [Hylaeus volcanicus]